jgi:hypothetical protein
MEGGDMTALAPITPKLVKLIPLLGTDKDGEIIGTVHAIRRTLESAGCDLHDLALVVERAALPAMVEQPRQDASPAPELKPWQLTAMHCIRAGTGRLRPAEQDLLSSMVHWPGEPSDKQARWLDAIASALGLEVAA